MDVSTRLLRIESANTSAARVVIVVKGSGRVCFGIGMLPEIDTSAVVISLAVLEMIEPILCDEYLCIGEVISVSAGIVIESAPCCSIDTSTRADENMSAGMETSSVVSGLTSSLTFRW